MNETTAITARHRDRDAIVYVRQSSARQLEDHAESTRAQFALREKAIALGWPRPIVIDGDLGVSAGGYIDRPGFQNLLTRIATGQVGIILCFDASRLSRNSKDWAHLFELCRFFDSLIADGDQVYDLARPNDRLIIGIKGTVSEMELNLIRNRMRSGIDTKAARGELRFLLPVGYVHDPEDRIVFDPDQRIRCAVQSMFEQFDRMTSVRQLALWYLDTKTRFPSKLSRRNSVMRWEVPTSNTLRKLLLHPIYAGAYVFGRRQTVVEYRDGKIHKRELDPRPAEQASVCIHDHHPGFIPWSRFLANRARILDNRPRWNMHQNKGAIREGLALLPGLLRCARCGSKIRVGYKQDSALYYCDGGAEKGSRRCFAFGSAAIDHEVGEQVCAALSPHALDAARQAAVTTSAQHAREIENANLQVEAAQYSADRAFEQFDQCDPKNRLVADTLEERLNAKLADLHAAKEHQRQVLERKPEEPENVIERLHDLGRDFPRVWNHPQADARLKKRLLRAAIREILVQPLEDPPRLEVTIHWQGGVHTRCHVNRPIRASGKPGQPLDQLVRTLAAELEDREIARVLNMNRTTTPRGNPWTQDRVREFRKQNRICTPSNTEARNTLTMNQVQSQLGLSHNAVLGMVKLGLLVPNQIAPFAPWRVLRTELDSDAVRRAVAQLKTTRRLPKGGCPIPQPELFDADKELTTEVMKGAL